MTRPCPIRIAHDPHTHPNIHPCPGIKTGTILARVERNKTEAWRLTGIMRSHGIHVTITPRTLPVWQQVHAALAAEYQHGLEGR